jgi:ABC-type dipeptide/oligopeptide/nickel transport system permease subunit
MVNFAFGLLLGYMLGMALGYYIVKIDRDIKNGRG